MSPLMCLFYDWDRGAYWLLRLLCSPNGHWAKHSGCCVTQQLWDNLTSQHKPSVQVWHCFYLLFIAVHQSMCCFMFKKKKNLFLQGFFCIMFGGHLYRQRKSNVVLLFSLWSQRHPGGESFSIYSILEQMRQFFMGTFLLCFVQEKFGIAHLTGMSCVVDGTIPPSSGLSSSSALVCCAGLVTMEANQKSLSKVLKRKKCFHSTLLVWERLSPLWCDYYPGGSGWNMCQERALHWDRGRRYGPVHLIPGRERNGAKLFIAVYFDLSVGWSQSGRTVWNVNTILSLLSKWTNAKKKGF